MVNPSEEVLLILNRTEAGPYWSYNFEDGVWIINNGKVKSLSQQEALTSGKPEQDLKKFVAKITAAAKNKKIPITSE
ncbi:hypothetical protein DX130_13950 [Paenibacillus paeoniae]|uniref:Uncharacterized protein n=1 Tax=Paenibacillus paeoniae TaxID=2292705 RepID=A0A371PFP3_9BACL|nr:hypothetical protein DX130_13950 [Paenibacillus paeoniae]